MIIKLIIFFIFLFFAQSGYSAEDTGTRTAEFLKIPPSVRGAGTGNAFVSVPGGIDSIPYNPSGLCAVKYIEGSIFYSPYLADTSLVSLSGAMNLGDAGVIGLNITDLNYGAIPETLENSSGDIIATGKNSEPSDLLLSGTYSKRLAIEGLHLGMNLKYITLGSDNVRGNGVALDAGCIFKKGASPWGVGIAINNIGTKIKFAQLEYSIPLILRIGGHYNYEIAGEHTLSVLLDLEDEKTEGINLNTGMEYSFHRSLFIRGGYQTGRDPGGYHLGGGLKHKIMRFDYGFESYGDLGTVHQIQVSIILSPAGPDKTEKEGPKKNPPMTEPEATDDPSKEKKEQKKADEEDENSAIDYDIDSIIK
ncbi:MAG: PorV/PorQ family protein [Spirochaetes bacterium]|nr:PorV/PorQ family protein [Spirochaetota bacterium]